MSKTILLFEITNEKKQALNTLCHSLSIQAKYIMPKEYGQTLGTLAGIQGFTKKQTGSSPLLNTEMLVFSGMNSDQIDQFLAAYKQYSLTPISLKAVLTPYNIRWTPAQLCEELKKEHRSISSKK